MLLIDVNVLVYAYREDAPDHRAYLRWLEECLGSDQTYGMADLLLAGFLRAATHPRVFTPPSPLESALRFATALRDQPNCVSVVPGPRHWEIFDRLCRVARVKGNLVADAFLGGAGD